MGEKGADDMTHPTMHTSLNGLPVPGQGSARQEGNPPVGDLAGDAEPQRLHGIASGQDTDIPSNRVPQARLAPGLPAPVRLPADSPRSSRTREDGVEQATLARQVVEEPHLNEEEIRLLAQIASGVTADVAARRLELSARTLRRRLRAICDRLGVNTPIEAVVWAARRQLI